MEFSVETAFSAEIQAICLKLCGNRLFLQNLQTKELVKNAVFYATIIQNISVWQTYNNNVVITVCVCHGNTCRICIFVSMF